MTEAKENRAADTVETLDRTTGQLTRMRQYIERTNRAPAGNNAAPEQRTPAARNPVESVWYKPQTWNPEERAKATQIAVIGTGVVGGLLLMKWIWDKTKKAGETVKEKTSSAWSFLKFATIAGVLTVGGYFGWRGFNKLKEKMQVMKEVEELRRAIGSMPEELRAQAESRLREMEEWLRRYKEGNGTTTPGAAPPVGVPNETPSDIRETAETTVRTASDIIVSKGILSSVDRDTWIVPEDAKEQQLQGILLLNSELTMAEIFDRARRGEGADQIFKRADTDRESRKQAAELMLEFCGNKREHVVQYLMRRKEIDRATAGKDMLDMKLPEFARSAVIGSSAAIEAVETLTTETGDVVTRIQNLDLQSIAQGSEAMHQELRDFIDENAEDLGIDTSADVSVDPATILKVIVRTKAATVADQAKKIDETGPANMEEKIIRAVFEKLRTGDTHLYALPLFHGIFPTNDGNRSEAERVKTYIVDRMPPDQALRLYMYRRMMDKGYASGLVLMQLEILKFIAAQDESLLGDKKYEVILRMGRSMTEKTGEELAEEWRKLGIELDYPEMFEVGAKTIGLAGAGIAYGTGKVVRENLGLLSALAKQETLFTIGTGAALFEGVPRLILNNMISSESMREGLQGWAGVAEKQDWLNRGIDGTRRLILGPSADDIVHASQNYDKIHNAIHNLEAGNPLRKELIKLRDACLRSPKSSSAWKNLATRFSAKGFAEAAAAAGKFSETAGMRNAAYIQRYAFLKGGTFYSKSFYRNSLRLYDSAKAIAIEGVPKALNAIRNSAFAQEIATQTGAKLEEAVALLSKIDVPPAVLEAFAKSKGAMTMLLNASKAGAPAVEYLMKIGTLAQKLAPALGMAAIGLEGVICAIEIAMNQSRIANTDNAALKELYAKRDAVSAANAAAGTAMAVAWLVIGWAPAGAVVSASTFAPAVAALFAAKYSHDRLEEVSETWLSEEKDWLKKTPGELRERMEAMGPGEQSYWQQAAGGTRLGNWVNWATMNRQEYAQWQKSVYQRIEDANEGARFDMTRAYLAKMTTLPPKQGESKDAYAERAARFLTDQALFIADASKGEFGLQLNSLYRAAPVHAELKALSAELTATSGSQIIEIPVMENGAETIKEFDLARYNDFTRFNEFKDGISPMNVITAYQRQRRGLVMLQSALLKEAASGDPDAGAKRDLLLQRTLLEDVRHELAACDEKLRRADLEGWAWTGGEEASRDRVRSAVSTAFRRLLREESDRLQAKEYATPEDMDASIQRLTAFLQRDPQQLAELANDASETEADASGAALLDRDWLANHLFVRSPSNQAT